MFDIEKIIVMVINWRMVGFSYFCDNKYLFMVLFFFLYIGCVLIN